MYQAGVGIPCRDSPTCDHGHSVWQSHSPPDDRTGSEYHHFGRLNHAFRSDLQWWRMALPCWNGTKFITPLSLPIPIYRLLRCVRVMGFGAWCQPAHNWFQGSWPSTWSSVTITAKELLSIIPGAAIWGPLWSGQAVRFHCDNAAIVHTIH